MAYKTFIDLRNNYWQVWDVRPERMERRSVERRGTATTEWNGIERRVGERRKLERTRLVLDNGLGSGWLVFESRSEKRRLTPIPRDWEKSTESELRFLCDRAVVARIANGNSETSAA